MSTQSAEAAKSAVKPTAKPRPGEPEITLELAKEHGLTQMEYAMMLGIMGRNPTLTELGIFSAMWSEHCSYKSSRAFLARLPTKAPWVIQGPGENAGVIDVGNQEALDAFTHVVGGAGATGCDIAVA